MAERVSDIRRIEVSRDIIDLGWRLAQMSSVAWDNWQEAEKTHPKAFDKNGDGTELSLQVINELIEAEDNFEILSNMASLVINHPDSHFDETTPYPATPVEELHGMQDQFSAILGVDPELLRGLELCGTCGGFNHRWEDVTSFDMGEHHDIGNSAQEYQEYRHQIAENTCDACEGSGFEGGSWRFSPDEWVTLSQSKINPTA
jgi:hypothetical protein